MLCVHALKPIFHLKPYVGGLLLYLGWIWNQCWYFLSKSSSPSKWLRKKKWLKWDGIQRFSLNIRPNQIFRLWINKLIPFDLILGSHWAKTNFRDLDSLLWTEQRTCLLVPSENTLCWVMASCLSWRGFPGLKEVTIWVSSLCRGHSWQLSSHKWDLKLEAFSRWKGLGIHYCLSAEGPDFENGLHAAVFPQTTVTPAEASYTEVHVPQRAKAMLPTWIH